VRIHNFPQGSREWLAARIGIPTASNFHKILTPKTEQYSIQAREYAYRLIAETLLNESLDSLFTTEHMERGKELEPQAVALYEFEQDISTEPIGFITTDDGRIGCSPDRVVTVGRPLYRAVEVKCPAPFTHLKWYFEGFGADYRPQVQGQCYVGEFEEVDRYSFHPRMMPIHDRSARDEPYIKKLADALERFADEKDEMLARVRASGFFAERQRLLTSTDDQAKSLGRDLHDYLGETP